MQTSIASRHSASIDVPTTPPKHRVTRALRFAWSLAVAVVSNTFTTVEADATNIDLLTRLLIPGYIALDYASICTTNNPQFLAQLPNGPTAIAAFAQHLKLEVTIDLKPSEAMQVRVAAADTARNIALAQLNKLREAKEAKAAEAAIRLWCDELGVAYIRNMIKEHYIKHDLFDDLVQQAKQ